MNNNSSSTTISSNDTHTHRQTKHIKFTYIFISHISVYVNKSGETRGNYDTTTITTATAAAAIHSSRCILHCNISKEVNKKALLEEPWPKFCFYSFNNFNLMFVFLSSFLLKFPHDMKKSQSRRKRRRNWFEWQWHI